MNTRPDPTRNLELVNPEPDPTRPVTVSAMAAELGTTNPALRKWARRRGLLPEASPGTAVTFTREQADAVRQAWHSGRPDPTRPVTGSTHAKPDPEPDPTHGPERVDPAAGWRELVAELRHERDRLRSDLAVATAARDVAVGRAESAEAALYTTAARLESLRTSVALWYALLRRPLWRLRPLPALPAEVTSSAPMLARLEG